MKVKTTISYLMVAFLIVTSSSFVKAQSDDYKEGSVWTITMVRTKPGMSNEYLKSIKSTLKLINDEAVKQGLILSYKVMQGPSANQDDWNIMLMEEFKNLAATEGHDDQWKAIKEKVLGGADAEKKLMQSRLDIREILGDKMMREVIFK